MKSFIKIIKSIGVFIGAIIPFIESTETWVEHIRKIWKNK